MVRTIKKLQRFHVLYATKESFKTVVGGRWHDYFGRPFTYADACEKAAGLEGQYANYNFKILHEKLVSRKQN